jgi:hypothetical protein
VIGFREIDELEVEGEGAREQRGLRDRDGMDERECGGGVASDFGFVAAVFSVAACDGALAQGFDFFEEVFASLLAQDDAEQRAQRAHVAAQGASLRSPVCASSSARRCDQLSGSREEAS